MVLISKGDSPKKAYVMIGKTAYDKPNAASLTDHALPRESYPIFVP